MQLKHHSNYHLSYCTNVHPGTTWQDIFSQIREHVPRLRNRLSPGKPFGIGLRLSAAAALELRKNEVLSEFRSWLKSKNLYVFTINGFVYGSFHGERVKEEVYLPDWSSGMRVQFTLDMIKILAKLLPEGGEGSISTSPVSYKYRGLSDEELQHISRQAAENLARLAWEMNAIHSKQNKLIHVDIEPEPDCLLETTVETIHFFKHILLPVGADFLKQKHQVKSGDASGLLKRHIRVCFDTCHVALEYEDPAEAVRMYQDAEIEIGKVQVSSALKVVLTDNRHDVANNLRKFIEPVYLHQVLARKKDGSITQYRDLDSAINQIHDPETAEWRVHFHVPVFLESYGPLSSTQSETRKSIQLFLENDICRHFEIETYTWDVLPDELKTDMDDSIEREIRWTLDLIDHVSTHG